MEKLCSIRVKLDIVMNYYCQPPQYQLGESFVAVLASFKSFCESSEAPDVAKKHVFLSSLPVNMKFVMQEGNKQLYELSIDELKKKASEVACGKQCGSARQQLKAKR